MNIPFYRSAGLRLTVLIAAAITLISLVGMAVQYRLVTGAPTRLELAAIQADLDNFAAIYDQRRIISLRQAMEHIKQSAGGDDMVYLLLDKKGIPLGGNLAAWPTGLAVQSTPPFEVQALIDLPLSDTQGHFRGVARTLPGGFRFLLGRSTAAGDRLLAGLRANIALTAGALVLLSLLAGQGWPAWCCSVSTASTVLR